MSWVDDAARYLRAVRENTTTFKHRKARGGGWSWSAEDEPDLKDQEWWQDYIYSKSPVEEKEDDDGNT